MHELRLRPRRAGWHRALPGCLFATAGCAGTTRPLFSPCRCASLPCTSFCGRFLWLPQLGEVDACRQPLLEVLGQLEPPRLSCGRQLRFPKVTEWDDALKQSKYSTRSTSV